MHRLDLLDKETARLHELLKVIQSNKFKEDKIWDNFCKEMSKEKETKKYFKKHPKHISNSSSEILSPRLYPPAALRRGAKSVNNIKFIEPTANTRRQSDDSIEVVTIREEFPLKRTIKSSISTIDKKPSTLRDRKRIKEAKTEENQSQVTVINKNPVTKTKSSKVDIKKEEKIYVYENHKDNFEIKLQSIIEKSLVCMEELRVQLDVGISPPDGLDDLERRKRRSTEFASRFSRNYLYQFNRQISDMRKLLKPSSARVNNQSNFLIRQKLTSSYQTVLQGLQAYLNHLPISTPIAVPEKVKDLLKEVTTLCEIHRQYGNYDINSNVKNAEIIDVFEVRSRCLIEKIDECFTSPSALSFLQSHSKFSLSDAHKQRKLNVTKSRFSMYNGPPSRKDVYWKRAVGALAKKKFNVRSKYKTAYFKHRPPAEKPSQIKPTTKSKHLERKSSGNLKAKSVIDDDNIKTMMEIQKEKEHQLGIKDSISFTKIDDTVSIKSETLLPLVEKLVEKLNAENGEMSQEQLRCALKTVTDSSNQTDNDLIGELANKLLSPAITRTTTTVATSLQEIPQTQQEQVRPPDAISSNEEIVDKLVEVIWNHSKERQHATEDDNMKSARKKRKERKKTITVTGAKNAQLICIKDEDSLNEPSLNTTIEEIHFNSRVNVAPVNPDNFIQKETKTAQYKDVNIQQNAQQPNTAERISRVSSADRTPRMKISRLPKIPLQPLQMLPKKFALNILEYKINYLKARKGNHMYKKSSIRQPWILMGDISDKILDDLLQAIGLEIQVDCVIDGIIASEFV